MPIAKNMKPKNKAQAPTCHNCPDGEVINPRSDSGKVFDSMFIFGFFESVNCSKLGGIFAIDNTTGKCKACPKMTERINEQAQP